SRAQRPSAGSGAEAAVAAARGAGADGISRDGGARAEIPGHVTGFTLTCARAAAAHSVHAVGVARGALAVVRARLSRADARLAGVRGRLAVEVRQAGVVVVAGVAARQPVAGVGSAPDVRGRGTG